MLLCSSVNFGTRRTPFRILYAWLPIMRDPRGDHWRVFSRRILSNSRHRGDFLKLIRRWFLSSSSRDSSLAVRASFLLLSHRNSIASFAYINIHIMPSGAWVQRVSNCSLDFISSITVGNSSIGKRFDSVVPSSSCHSLSRKLTWAPSFAVDFSPSSWLSFTTYMTRASQFARDCSNMPHNNSASSLASIILSCLSRVAKQKKWRDLSNSSKSWIALLWALVSFSGFIFPPKSRIPGIVFECLDRVKVFCSLLYMREHWMSSNLSVIESPSQAI